MAAQPVMTAEELVERVRHAPPPTEDDVTILWDGRRLDSREAALEWLAEVAAKRGRGGYRRRWSILTVLPTISDG